MHTKAQTGWNDPPMIAPKIKPPPVAVKPAEMPTFFQPAPITSSHPPMNNYPPQHQLGYQQQQQQQPNQMFQPPINNQPQMFQPANLVASQQSHVFQPSLPQQSFQPLDQGSFQPSQFQQQQHLQQSRPASVQQERVEAVEKGPIPSEYQNIKDTFDTLLKKCVSATSAPVARRKLEDAGKKLEILYDKLRDSSVSRSPLVCCLFVS